MRCRLGAGTIRAAGLDKIRNLRVAVQADEARDGIKLTQAHVKKGLIGTGNFMHVMTHLDDGSVSFLGFEKVTASLGEWRTL
ncbi:MAG: hypothetical protein OXI33_08340 [Chloroflexota bacterium]|nr:hypothetical protein [Chloroflexota bacterium]